jgi:hypothetical protein
MKIVYAGIAVVFMAGCASAPTPDTTDYSEIAVAVAPECQQSSVVVRELRGSDGKAGKSKKMPLRVPPGVYAIGVSCGTLFDSNAAACTDSAATSGKNDVAPYELVLQPRRRYTFSCGLRKGQNVIRLDEAAL